MGEILKLIGGQMRGQGRNRDQATGQQKAGFAAKYAAPPQQVVRSVGVRVYDQEMLKAYDELQDRSGLKPGPFLLWLIAYAIDHDLRPNK